MTENQGSVIIFLMGIVIYEIFVGLAMVIAEIAKSRKAVEGLKK